MQDSDEVDVPTDLRFQPFTAELTAETVSRIEDLEQDVDQFDVPVGCVHDSALTEAFRHLALLEAHCGIPAAEVASETVDTTVQHCDLPAEDDDREVKTVHLPVGKAEILREVSRECRSVNRPKEFRVFSALFDLGACKLSD